jgi:predicted hydrocarbon binding protein
MRRSCRALARWRKLRAHFALRIARRIIRGILTSTTASARLRRGRVRVRVEPSIFCAVREMQAAPLCGFYAALVRETLRAFGLEAAVRIESCRAVGGPACVVAAEFEGASVIADPARAA